jgi:hypothetical protein
MRVLRRDCALVLKVGGDALHSPDWLAAQDVMVLADQVIENAYLRRYEEGGLSIEENPRTERRVTGWQIEVRHSNLSARTMERKWIQVTDRSCSTMDAPLQLQGWVKQAYEVGGVLVLEITPGL